MKSSWYSFYMPELPALTSVEDLAKATRLSPGLIQGLLRADFQNYRVFRIPKGSGGTRKISAPKAPVAAVQGWILRNVLESIHLPDCATAFRKRRGIADNVKPHVNSKYFLSMDIQDFFGSIPYHYVFGVFSGLGYPREMSHCLTRLCTFDGALPQGGITSPALSNAVCIRLDIRLSACAGRLDLAYTRYADDFTFSGEDPSRLISMCRLATTIIEDEGFRVAMKKTRFARPGRRRMVTGLVVRDGGFGVPRASKRRLRAILHRLYTQELPPAKRVRLSRHVDGWYSFLHDVDKSALSSLRRYEERLKAKYARNRGEGCKESEMQ